MAQRLLSCLVDREDRLEWGWGECCCLTPTGHDKKGKECGLKKMEWSTDNKRLFLPGEETQRQKHRVPGKNQVKAKL